MTCPNCGAPNNEGVNFCVSCGTKLEAAAAPETAVPAAEVQDESLQQPVEAVETPVAPAPKEKKKLDKGLVIKIGIIAAAVVVLLVVLLVGLKACGGKKIDFAKTPVVYSTEDDYFILGSKDKAGKPLAEDDDYAGYSKLSLDGKTLFFGMDDDGGEYDLYYRNTSKKNETANTKIESGISWYVPTPDAKNVFYIKNDKLYKANLKNKATLLGKDVLSESIQIAPDMNGVIYKNDEGEVYYSNGKKQIKLSKADSASAYFSDNGKKIFVREDEEKEEMKDSDEFDTWEEYYEYQDEYYSQPDTYKILVGNVGKEPKEIAKDVTDHVSLDNYSKFYIINDEDELYLYKNGKQNGKCILEDAYIVYKYGEEGKEEIFAKTKETDKDGETTYSFYYIDGTKATLLVEDAHGFGSVYGDEDYTIFYSYEETYDEEEGYDTEYTYYVRNKNKVSEIDMPEECKKYYDAENGVLYTVEDIDEDDETGTLKKYDVKKNGIDFNKGKEIADDVYDISYIGFSDLLTVVMGKKHDEFAVYNGKKLVEVSDDFHSIVWLHKDGTLFIAEDYNAKDGTYTLSKFDGKKAVEVADDVKSAVVLEKNLIYFTNEDRELYRSTGKMGKEKCIDDDECYISHPYYMMSYLDYFYSAEEQRDMLDSVPYSNY